MNAERDWGGKVWIGEGNLHSTKSVPALQRQKEHFIYLSEVLLLRQIVKKQEQRFSLDRKRRGQNETTQKRQRVRDVWGSRAWEEGEVCNGWKCRFGNQAKEKLHDRRKTFLMSYWKISVKTSWRWISPHTKISLNRLLSDKQMSAMVEELEHKGLRWKSDT